MAARSEEAVCELDWLRFLFGEPVAIKSMCSRRSDLEIDTHDVTQFLIDFGPARPQIGFRHRHAARMAMDAPLSDGVLPIPLAYRVAGARANL